VTWQRVRLLEVAPLVKDRVTPWVGVRRYIATGDADDEGNLGGVAITYEERPSRADLVGAPGDIAFARMAATAKVFVMDERASRAVFSTGFAILRPRPERANVHFLKHWLRSSETQLTMDSFSAGATQRALTNAGLGALEMPLPPVSEQQRIAAILDAADAIRAKRRAQLAHLDDLPQVMFREMFGALSADAVVTDVLAATRGAIRTGPFGSQLLHEEFVDEGIAVLGLDNVVSNEFRWGARRFITPEKYAQLRRYTVHPGDVLISIMGTTGRCAIVPADIPTAINTKHICALTLATDVALPQFVRAAFLWHPASRSYLMRETKGAIMAGLNMGIIKRMPLPLPSLAVQQEFAAKVEAIHAERARVARALEADDELFAALQHRAFRGEL